jgi:hypothetical protein
METLKVITIGEVKQVEITPAVITPPKRVMPLDMYVKQLNAQKVRLETQLADINAKVAAVDKAVKPEE